MDNRHLAAHGAETFHASGVGIVLVGIGIAVTGGLVWLLGAGAMVAWVGIVIAAVGLALLAGSLLTHRMARHHRPFA